MITYFWDVYKRQVFTVNESQYSELLSQVRTAEFDKEIHERIQQELALAEQKALNEQQELSLIHI